MRLSYKPYQLELKYPFTIAKFSRTSTPLMLLEIEHEGKVGLGEASMVPYMGESIETAIKFLKKIDLNWFSFPLDLDEVIAYLDDIEPGLPAIKAAVDIALHDLTGKLLEKPCYELFGSSPDLMPLTTFTVGIDEPEIIIKKVNDALADGFKLLKIKLGRESDKLLIETIRSVTDMPLYVDANQGWADKKQGLEMAFWLQEQGVLLIEQPMPKEDIDGNAWITENSPIPIIGDEAIQRLDDVQKAKGIYHGINIKLMKSAGMHEAFKMIKAARENNLKILIGCMSETSIATLAGVALAPLCDYADLDGPFLTLNNPFKTPEFKQGKYILNKQAGLGVNFI
ncbi:dipeptide epimerase [Pedobacter psychrophilus]|uniref:Dipeptide epimerase n=1 Tax=Pedobacter psychrophilus TaxID=1826909 RepID=A0A179DE25_9SPHI|nr:dipeptide epimerase [Pedobacter psychrophilus]OAQ39305.1 dipeptide epimerase [Pedobacter psychrophilus]